jgi:hypothetical protein
MKTPVQVACVPRNSSVSCFRLPPGTGGVTPASLQCLPPNELCYCSETQSYACCAKGSGCTGVTGYCVCGSYGGGG